jgi:hypothetical protein
VAAVAPAAVPGRPAALLGLLPRGATDALHTGAAEDDALAQHEQLAQVAVVAGGEGPLAKRPDLLPQLIRQTPLRRPATIAMHEGSRSSLAVSGSQASDLTQ